MKCRLVLATTPLSLAERYGSFSGAANTEPSFGLACLASVARKWTADVRIVEASAENLSPEQTLREIMEFDPDVVGLSATTAGIHVASNLAAAIKSARPTTLVLLGGCHVSAIPRETLAEFKAIDLGIVGEGERTLIDILERTDPRGHAPSGTPGTVERIGDEIVLNEPRPLITDLDELPLPAWSLLRGFPSAFHPSPARIRRWPCASLVLSRGCPNCCTFCDRSVFGSNCRAYSAGYAVRLIKDLRDNFGVRELLMEDDTFITSRSRMVELCESLIAEKLDLSWSCLGRADRVDPDLLKLMKKAGCWHISFGIESGDQEILRAVNKRLDIGQITEAVEWCRAAGIRTKGFFMVGFPNETKESLNFTSDLACTLPLDDISVMQLTPFPGSELFKTAEQYGTFEKDWRRMNTLETVFVPRGFTKADLEMARALLLRRFYLQPRILLGKLAAIVRRPRLLGGMLNLFFALIRTLITRGQSKNSPVVEPRQTPG